LANKFGINDYPCPSGGCLLTDPEFSKRVKDLIIHQELTLENVKLLKMGRHFRLNSAVKLIVGRDEKEGSALMRLAKAGDYIFMPPEEIAGPTCLGRGFFDERLITLAARITCAYCDTQERVIYKKVGEEKECSSLVGTVDKNEFLELRI